MLRGWTGGLAAARKAYLSSRDLSAPARRRRALILALGAAAYTLALLATLPARFLLDLGPRWMVAGTLWSGEAMLDGGWRLEWRWSPARTLASLAFAADVRMTGAGTDLAGTVTAWRDHRLFEELTGRADGALIAALVPSFPLRCDAALQVGVHRLLLAGTNSAATGELRADAASCLLPGTTTQAPLPPLLVRALPLAGTTRIDLAPLDRPRLKLVEGGIADGRLRLTPTAAGMALQPALRALAVDVGL